MSWRYYKSNINLIPYVKLKKTHVPVITIKIADTPKCAPVRRGKKISVHFLPKLHKYKLDVQKSENLVRTLFVAR